MEGLIKLKKEIKGKDKKRTGELYRNTIPCSCLPWPLTFFIFLFQNKRLMETHKLSEKKKRKKHQEKKEKRCTYVILIIIIFPVSKK